MKWFERREFGWMVIATITLAGVIRILWIQQVAVDLILSITCLASIVAVVWILATEIASPIVVWDDRAATLAILRKWTVEVSSARLMGSVPIGIDLSHSAKKVLQSVYTRYSSGPSVEVVFFVARPLGNGVTRVGILVKRSAMRLRNGIRCVDSLRKQVVKDAALLESAMRAAYPHLPVTKAELDDMMIAVTGGIETNVGSG
ncbi:MAG: hypothetical protein EAX95_15810 [Candidatus Thorarchaeota archaeon]|nr:hypothetical protein [Candidatus Thorarchaeota archaeon]